MASCLLVDLALRANDVDAMMASDGAVHHESWVMPPLQLCFHCINGASTVQYALLAVQAVFALALLVGHRTQLATVASFVLLASLHTRLPVVLNGGDDVLRVFMFWAMFLPLGRVWSFDAVRCSEALMRRRARRNKRRNFNERSNEDDAGADDEEADDDDDDDDNDEELLNDVDNENDDVAVDRVESGVVSLASMAFVINLVLVYIVAGATKTGASWMRGDAVHNSLHMIDYATSFAVVARRNVALLRVLSPLTLFVECGVPLLYLAPFARGACRLAAIAIFVGMHASFGLLLRIGMFPLACIVW